MMLMFIKCRQEHIPDKANSEDIIQHKLYLKEIISIRNMLHRQIFYLYFVKSTPSKENHFK